MPAAASWIGDVLHLLAQLSRRTRGCSVPERSRRCDRPVHEQNQAEQGDVELDYRPKSERAHRRSCEAAKYSPWTRFRQEREYGLKASARIREFRPDVVLSANTPQFAQKHLLSETKQLGSRFVFWQQDLLGIGVRRVLERRYGRLGAAIGNAS